MFSIFLAVAASAAAATSTPTGLDALSHTRLDAALRCHLGAYRLADGRSITINGSGGQSRAFHYTLSSKEFGTLSETPDGSFSNGSVAIRFAPCENGTLALDKAGRRQTGTDIGLLEHETYFVSDGHRLHGKLVLPPKGRAKAIVVWIEGSNNNPSTDDAIWQYELARRGIGVFTYDKRGTGASEGSPSADFHLRARDTAAAVEAARSLAPNVSRVGVLGASQGGWVAPLTASLVPLDFVVAAYGLAESPIAQDKALVEQQVRQAGFGASEIEAAQRLTAITETIVRTNLSLGFEDLETFKVDHAGSPWLQAIQPRSYTGLFLRFSSDDIRLHGPALSQGLTFAHEPRPTVENLPTRQLWLLGGADTQAPSTGTQAILRDIQKRRQNLAVVVFPRADHGLVEPAPAPNDAALAFSARQFDLAADWIKHGRLPSRSRFIQMR